MMKTTPTGLTKTIAPLSFDAKGSAKGVGCEYFIHEGKHQYAHLGWCCDRLVAGERIQPILRNGDTKEAAIAAAEGDHAAAILSMLTPEARTALAPLLSAARPLAALQD